MTLISYVSLLGFNNTFVRFLPSSTERSNEINTGLLLCTCGAITLAVLYLIAIPWIAPGLGILNQNIFYALGFISIAVAVSLNLLTDSIFIAFRATKYNLLIDGVIQSFIKLLLPFLFLSLGAYGVFAASGAAAAVALVASIYYLVIKFDYKPRLHIDLPTLKKVTHYSSANYIANVFNIAPTLLLPLIVLNHLGSASAAYYYLAFTITNLLYAVVYAVSQSLFAEGSYAECNLAELTRRSVLIMSSLLIPGAVVLFFAAPMVLLMFGKSYATEAVDLLKVFLLTAPAVAFYILTNLLLRIKGHSYLLISTNIFYFCSIAGLAYLWVDLGLVWVGFAWLVGNLATGLIGLLLLLRPDTSAQPSH